MLPTVHIRRYRLFPLLIIIVLVLATLATLLTEVRETQITHAAPPCASAPAGFDPTTATNATLAKYGFPLRMTTNPKSSAYQSWLKLAKSVKHHVCSTSTAPSKGQPKNTIKTAVASGRKYFASFSGYEALPGKSIAAITGSWDVPCARDRNRISSAVVSEIELDSPIAVVLAIGTSATYAAPNHSGDFAQFAAEGGIGGINYADSSTYPVKCGDSVSASITSVTSDPLGGFSGSGWYAWIGDQTSKVAFSYSEKGYDTATAAYWGDEGASFQAPSSSSPLMDFSQIPWIGCKLDTTGRGNFQAISQYPNSLVQMNNLQGQGLAYPNALDSSGAGFTDSWFNVY